MTDFFKSALGSLISGATGQQDNDFVGQTCELGNQKLRVKKLIAEGDYPFIIAVVYQSIRKCKPLFYPIT